MRSDSSTDVSILHDFHCGGEASLLLGLKLPTSDRDWLDANFFFSQIVTSSVLSACGPSEKMQS